MNDIYNEVMRIAKFGVLLNIGILCLGVVGMVTLYHPEPPPDLNLKPLGTTLVQPTVDQSTLDLLRRAQADSNKGLMETIRAGYDANKSMMDNIRRPLADGMHADDRDRDPR